MTRRPKTLDELNERFKWAMDRTVWDWIVPVRYRRDGVIRGDCEGYAWLASRIEAGSLLVHWLRVLTCLTCFWLTRDKFGRGHVHVWSFGHGWIDNQHPAWGARMHRRGLPVQPVLYLAGAVGLWLGG